MFTKASLEGKAHVDVDAQDMFVRHQGGVPAVTGVGRLTSTRGFPWLRYVVVVALILLVSLAPLGSAVFASVIAEAWGCPLDERSVHPCMIGGTDWGRTLSNLFVFGWLGLVTIPFGLLGLLVQFLTFVVHRILWWRRRTAAS